MIRCVHCGSGWICECQEIRDAEALAEWRAGK